MKAFSELDKSRAIQKIIETKQIDVNQLPKKRGY